MKSSKLVFTEKGKKVIKYLYFVFLICVDTTAIVIAVVPVVIICVTVIICVIVFFVYRFAR